MKVESFGGFLTYFQNNSCVFPEGNTKWTDVDLHYSIFNELMTIPETLIESPRQVIQAIIQHPTPPVKR